MTTSARPAASNESELHQMNAQMTAYRLLEWEKAPQLVTVDVPKPGPGQVLIRIAGNGLCHSDIGMGLMPASIGELIGWSMPFTLGHEIGGYVEEVAEGAVDTYGKPVVVGQAVALVSPSSCGICKFCRSGLDSACPNGLAGRGYGRDGGLAGYVVADAARSVLPLTNVDPLAAAPLTDAGSTSYHAVRRAVHLLEPGSTAVVLGAGGLGSFAIQLIKAMSPARVIAVDQHKARQDYARELGADETLDGVDGSTAGSLRELTGGDGAEVVLDFVGIDATIAAGLASTPLRWCVRAGRSGRRKLSWPVDERPAQGRQRLHLPGLLHLRRPSRDRARRSRPDPQRLRPVPAGPRRRGV